MQGIDWTPVLQAAIEALVLVVAALWVVVKGPLAAWIHARTTDRERDIIIRLAQEAVHAAEAVGGTQSQRNTMARNYVNWALKGTGVSFTDEQVGQAIEAALAFAQQPFDKGGAQ